MNFVYIGMVALANNWRPTCKERIAEKVNKEQMRATSRYSDFSHNITVFVYMTFIAAIMIPTIPDTGGLRKLQSMYATYTHFHFNWI